MYKPSRGWQSEGVVGWSLVVNLEGGKKMTPRVPSPKLHLVAPPRILSILFMTTVQPSSHRPGGCSGCSGCSGLRGCQSQQYQMPSPKPIVELGHAWLTVPLSSPFSFFRIIVDSFIHICPGHRPKYGCSGCSQPCQVSLCGVQEPQPNGSERSHRGRDHSPLSSQA